MRRRHRTTAWRDSSNLFCSFCARILLGVRRRRHDTASRRLFRRSAEEAGSDPQGFVAAGGVKTLFVWGHREWKKGNTHQVTLVPSGELQGIQPVGFL